MPSKREIDELRAEVARRQRAAASKIYRLKANGVILGGSEFDPRRDTNRVARYNSAQLKKYLDDLNSFTRRNVQFVAGSEGVPLPKHRARALEMAVERVNRSVARHLSDIGDIKLRDQDMTIKQREATVENPDIMAAKGQPSKRPMSMVDFEAKHVTSAKSLESLISGLNARLTSSYLPEELAKQREQAKQMFDRIGNAKWSERMAALSDRQFNALWNHDREFMREMSHGYFIVTSQMANVNEPYFARMVEDSLSGIGSGISWAEQIRP